MLLKSNFFMIFIVLFFGCQIQCFGDERDELLALFNAVRNNIAVIRSHEFKLTERSGDNRVDGTHRIVQSGAMKRSDLFLDEANQPELIFCYDGNKYQNYSRSSSALSYSNLNRFPTYYGTIHPVVLLFCWLTDMNSSSIEDLQSPKTWAGLQKRIIWKSVARRGRQFNFTVTDVNEPLRSFTISIDTTSLLPDTIECRFKEQIIFTIQLRSHVIIKTMNDEVWFPTEISSVDGKVNRSYSIAPDSIRVNHAVSPSRFTLSHSMATVIDDYDRNTDRLLKSGALDAVENSVEPRSNRNYQYYVLIAVIAMVTLTLRRRGLR
jgi:hypothetical protein